MFLLPKEKCEQIVFHSYKRYFPPLTTVTAPRGLKIAQMNGQFTWSRWLVACSLVAVDSEWLSTPENSRAGGTFEISLCVDCIFKQYFINV